MKLFEIARKIKRGLLGLVSQDQYEAHLEAKEKKHKWIFGGTMGIRRGSRKITTRQKCMICTLTREINEKGHVVRR